MALASHFNHVINKLWSPGQGSLRPKKTKHLKGFKKKYIKKKELKRKEKKKAQLIMTKQKMRIFMVSRLFEATKQHLNNSYSVKNDHVFRSCFRRPAVILHLYFYLNINPSYQQ